MGEEGIQRVPLTSDGSETETEPCDTALPKGLDDAYAPGGPPNWRFPAITPITPPVVGVSHRQFCESVKGCKSPGDDSGRKSFDTCPTFVVGDPGARFGTHTPLTYETTGEVGHPCWPDVFAHILRNCSYLTAFDTVYVMVDTRNLRAHVTKQEGLPHWPAAVAWWQSRLQLVGPKQEKTELLFFPANEQSGLHRVHPTWAGTFVLAALVAVFPGINFIPLDSDCLPVTLCEAADLWKESYLARFPLGTGRALPTKHPLHRKQVYHSDPRVVFTQHRVDENRVGQGVLLVTEPHSELNAGLVAVFGSSHPPLFQWEEWTHLCRGTPEEHMDQVVSAQAKKLEDWFFDRVGEFLTRTLGENDLTPIEKQYWIQSGLALGFFMPVCVARKSTLHFLRSIGIRRNLIPGNLRQS